MWRTLENSGGGNKYQETVFAISVYEKQSIAAFLKNFNYSLTGNLVKINGMAANQLDDWNIMFQQGDYIYVVYSSFMDIIDDSEVYKEYVGILNTLNLF